MARTAWEIAGRSVLITGGARGIGLETGRRLAARGMQVTLADIDGDRAAAEAERIGGIGLSADVTDAAAVDACVATAVERFGGLDVVVANAGVGPPPATLLSVDPADFERTVAVDLHGVWQTVRAALPHVVERRGHVLVVASTLAAMAGPLAASYAISKAGVEQLGRALRIELGPHGATAGVAYFGFIDTALVRDVFAEPVNDALRRAYPGWITRPIPVARAGEAMALGIERRSPRVVHPWWLKWMLATRGLLSFLDGRLARDAQLAEAVRLAEVFPAAGAKR